MAEHGKKWDFTGEPGREHPQQQTVNGWGEIPLNCATTGHKVPPELLVVALSSSRPGCGMLQQQERVWGAGGLIVQG